MKKYAVTTIVNLIFEFLKWDRGNHVLNDRHRGSPHHYE